MEQVNTPRKTMKTWIGVSLFCVFLSAVAVFPFFLLSQSADRQSTLWMPVTHDMILHFDQMKSFYRGLEAGEAYPRWEEDTNRGFGAPTTSYYPPGVYYLTSALYAIVGDWIWTLLFAQFLMMAASGFAIYLYAREVMSVPAALIAMAAYIFFPYHIFDQYQRGALAELLGFALMPLMLLFAQRLLANDEQYEKRRTPSRRLLNASGLAVTLAVFLWCHPPTAYQFMLAFGLFVVLSASIRKSWNGLLEMILAIVLGLSLSAAYLYPAFVEQNLIHREFISNTWPYQSTYIFAGDSGYDLVEFMWLFSFAAIVIGAVVLLFVERGLVKPNAGLRERIVLWLVVGCFASFMMTSASHFLVRLIPKIDIGVFAWRMLGITALVGALIAGACAQAALNASKQERRRGQNSLASLASLAIVGGAILVSARIVLSIYGAPGFSAADEHVNLAMMPATAPVEPLELPRAEPAQLAAGKGTVEVEKWDPEHRVLKVELSAPDKLLVRTFNFPGWVARVDGVPVTITGGQALRVQSGNSEETLIRAASYDVDGARAVEANHGRIIGSEPLGDIVIDLQPGARRVALDYVHTPPRLLGVIISSATSLLLIGLTLVSLRSVRVSK